MKKTLIIIVPFIFASCNNTVEKSSVIENKMDSETKIEESEVSNKIKVLNFATFHMGITTDANSVDFDENNEKNIQDAKKIAAMISTFKPTIICVEIPPNLNDEINTEYLKYLANRSKASNYYGEVGLVAFEVARLNNIATIYGIDHKLEHNYTIGNEIMNEIDSATVNQLQSNPFGEISDLNIYEEGLSLEEKLKRINHPKFLDFLILFNADILALIGTKEGFEGADEAAKYYQRNLRIYSNLNKIPLSKSDRIFILSGGSHTAFLGEFMKRSTKFELVNTMDYIN